MLFSSCNDTSTSAISTLSLHDALPIFCSWGKGGNDLFLACQPFMGAHSTFWRSSDGGEHWAPVPKVDTRSEEHTSELQSRVDLVCRLLLEKKKENEYYQR